MINAYAEMQLHYMVQNAGAMTLIIKHYSFKNIKYKLSN